LYRIPCPHCGPRAQAEFTYERSAEAVIDPVMPAEEAMDQLYTRTNPMGYDVELWRHTYGCRGWLVLTRNRVTHEISTVQPKGPEMLP